MSQNKTFFGKLAKNFPSLNLLANFPKQLNFKEIEGYRKTRNVVTIQGLPGKVLPTGVGVNCRKFGNMYLNLQIHLTSFWKVKTADFSQSVIVCPAFRLSGFVAV